jgi:hypothetical protein
MKKSELERLEELLEQKRTQGDARSLDFLKSLKDSVVRWGSLTTKQEEALKKIETLSSPEAREETEKWIKEYPIKFRADALVCAKYYLANPPYFSSLSKDIINKEKFVPTKSQYDHLCSNAFAKKVLAEYHREPTFERGELVQFRNSRSIPFHLSSLKSKLCVVVDNKYNFITTHAKGAKTYKLLPIGRSTTLLCQERWIKSFRKK